VELTGIGSVSAGYDHTCAIAASGGTVSCWGSRFYGQLGDGVFGHETKPVTVGPKATGAVTFRVAGKAIGTATLVDGVATLKKTLKAGLYVVTASYGGSPAYAASTAKAVSHLVTGTPKGETLTGGSAKDVLKAMGGADRIIGGAGDDTLDGGTGDDRVEGGAGRDTLTGGLGRDRFVFRRASESTPARPDLVADFKSGDVIDLSAFDGNLKKKGVQRFKTWRGTRRFTGKAGEVRFDAARARLEGDVNGDRRADFRVVLKGVKTLKGSAVKLK
jgi:Ca2+-binding RTX toxin-like protein